MPSPGRLVLLSISLAAVAGEQVLRNAPRVAYFTALFDSGAVGWSGAKVSPKSVSQTALLSLASVPNLDGELTIVTHASYGGLPALAAVASPIVRLEVLSDAEVDFAERPENWVLRVELMKYHFVRRRPPGAKVVYVELDQLFLPGAGRLFEATFDNHAFDAAFMFVPRCNAAYALPRRKSTAPMRGLQPSNHGDTAKPTQPRARDARPTTWFICSPSESRPIYPQVWLRKHGRRSSSTWRRRKLWPSPGHVAVAARTRRRSGACSRTSVPLRT